MIKITPLTQTKFTVPARQGKDIYSPIQNMFTKYKLAGRVDKDTIEFSTYNKEHASIVQKNLDDLKVNYKMTTKQTD